MTKKLPAPSDDEALAEAVRASAQQIWQAGLGAFARAQQEGGSAFTRLVRDGSVLQKRARDVEQASATVARAAERSSRRSGGSWGKLEQVFEERVARALAAIGVPAAGEVEALRRRIDDLEKTLAELASRAPQAAREPAASEVEALRRRVDALEMMLAELAARLPAAGARAALQPAPKAEAKAAPKAAAKAAAGTAPKARTRRPPKAAAAPGEDDGA